MDGIKIRVGVEKFIEPTKRAIFWILQLSFVFSFCQFSLAQQNPYALKTGHPRIIMTKYNELALRFIMMDDPLAQKLKNELKKDADNLLKSKKIKFELDDRNSILAISQEYFRRILTLSLAYRIFEDDKYSDNAIDQMLHVCSFPNWNTNHFLDVAEMTAALAIGYDWNFYHMNLREQETIRNKIVEYALNPGLDVYNNPDDKPHVWYKMNNHWNQVCSGGLILGALAVGDDFPDLKNNMIYQAVKNLIPTLDLYEPDGIWYEGPDYWDYANSYLALAFSSMESALEHDFGLSDRPGIEKSFKNYIKSLSPTGQTFNFGDAISAEPKGSPALFWFSKKYKQKDVADYYRKLLGDHLNQTASAEVREKNPMFYLSLPWFNEGEFESFPQPSMQYFRGLVDLMIFHGGEGEDALYLAAKGGKGILSHQHLDAGSFVVEADGERWGIDLGAEKQSLPNLMDYDVNGGRWEYFRNTNTSHNTIVIDDKIQYPDGEADVVEYKENINQPYGIIDMSAVYLEATRTRRGFKLLNDDQILIRDEIVFNRNPASVRWAMVTNAHVEISGKKAILSKNGKKFYLQAFTDEDVEFAVQPASAYHKQAKDNSGYSIIFFVTNHNKKEELVQFSVVMGRNLNGLNDIIVNSKLDSW